MEMGSLAQFLPMLMQMMQQNRPPTSTPGINPMAQQPPQMVPGAFGQMPGLSSTMSQRAPVDIYNSANPMGEGGLWKYKTATTPKNGTLNGLPSSFLDGLPSIFADKLNSLER